MQEVLLVVHLMLAIAIVITVLLQRSEGGALGMGGGSGGGGGGGGGLMTGREAANLLTRSTAVLAACFFATSLTLTIMATGSSERKSILEQSETGSSTNQPVVPAGPTVPTDK
ncbi:MAG: preprotein translocase subunit SecG [Rhodospirillaceae bacterium]|jgi:preprotein translocase subunit SecG|nr:preprotein translocase subunit SecG [Rhodospirillaceae bacterium]MBT3492525.1 preprotein translocase subunit SecG [Rhodospirillaceae bacterium]MBT3782394.1 preprotein translocase subunit SecG [Rhodospirillaceae bacterium]MBT3979023.1 preprotein translocase subunit SecG [Rhodospirillaceae bacterium]MBT4166518.1 preprotein translocase subunit SecG [Rhodospirillaceae bacterium]